MGVVLSNCFARMSRYLSGEELMQQCKRSNELPGRGGFKDHEPDGSWLQKTKLENFHAERDEVLSEERIEKLSALSVGVWDPEKRKVAVIRNRGKFWKNMGHCIDGEKFLYPEEALFLVDQGSMEVMSSEGHPMSLQELYHKLLPSARSCEDYVLCGHLMRLGFIVRRTDIPEDIHSRSDSDKKRLRDDDSGDGNDSGVQSSTAKKFKPCSESDSEPVLSTKEQKQGLDKNHVKLDNSTQQVIINNNNSSSSTDNNRNTNNNIPNLFDIFRSSLPDKVSVDPQSLSLALPDLELSQPLEFDISEERRKMMVVGKDLFGDPEKRRNCMGVENWNQLKNLSRKERLLLTPAKVLWDDDDDDLRPRHNPDVVCTPSETLKRLRRADATTEDDVSNAIGDRQSRDLNSGMFDVFPPDSKFKKSNPGRPLACTVSVSAQSAPPLGVGALKLIREAQKRGGSSLVFGAVDSGDVSFFSYNLVDLPTLV